MEFPTDSLHGVTEASTAESGSPEGGASRRFAPGLVILAHPEMERVGEEAPLAGLLTGRSVSLSRLGPLFLPPGVDTGPRPLEHRHLSRQPLLLSPGPGPGEVTLRGRGSPISVEVNGEPLGEGRTFTGEDLEKGVVLVLAGRVALRLLFLPIVPLPATPDFGLVGNSSAIARLRREIQAAALLEVPVLIRGETGSGKELVARGVHDCRARGGPYVAVNFGALVPALAASELFGATRGAYTGADRRRQGLFHRADGGTLFLDEIGEAPVEVQVMLLRTLESGRVQAVGGVEEESVDVRVIAATDTDLEQAIAEGLFRHALLHRLSGYEIRVPPLRERREDIPRLLCHFIREEGRSLGGEPLQARGERPWPSTQSIVRLVAYDWPGNVRELKNVARRLAVLHHLEGAVDTKPLLDQLLQGAEASTDDGSDSVSEGSPPKVGALRKSSDVSPEEMLETLERHEWRPASAAEALGISRAALYRLIESHPDLRLATDLEADEIRTALDHHGSIGEAAHALRVSRTGLRRRLKALGLDEPIS